MKTKRARQHIAPYSVTPRRALKEVGSHGKRQVSPFAIHQCETGLNVDVDCNAQILFRSKTYLAIFDSSGDVRDTQIGCTSEGAIVVKANPVFDQKVTCANVTALQPSAELFCSRLARRCESFRIFQYLDPTPTVAATGATAGLLSTLASLVTPTPTAVIAAAAPQTTLTYLAIGLGSAGALGTVGLAGYGAYKLGSWLCEDNNQIHPQESA